MDDMLWTKYMIVTTLQFQMRSTNVLYSSTFERIFLRVVRSGVYRVRLLSRSHRRCWPGQRRSLRSQVVGRVSSWSVGPIGGEVPSSPRAPSQQIERCWSSEHLHAPSQQPGREDRHIPHSWSQEPGRQDCRRKRCVQVCHIA